MIGNYEGKNVMVRTYSAGVHFGEFVTREGDEVILKNARRVHYWDGACSLSQLSTEGSSKRDNCRISVQVEEILIKGLIEIIPLTDRAFKNLDGGAIWQS